jgi:hypothetical protein
LRKWKRRIDGRVGKIRFRETFDRSRNGVKSTAVNQCGSGKSAKVRAYLLGISPTQMVQHVAKRLSQIDGDAAIVVNFDFSRGFGHDAKACWARNYATTRWCDSGNVWIS